MAKGEKSSGGQVLPGSRASYFLMPPEDLVIIGLDTKHKKGEHPLWDPRIEYEVEEVNVENVMMYGVIEPVVVRVNGGVPEVVDGRQRIRWLREANKRLRKEGKPPMNIKVIHRKDSEERSIGTTIAANVHINDDPLTSADKLEQYRNAGHTDMEAAITFCTTLATIGTWGKLTMLNPKVKDAIRAGKISPTAAAKLSALKSEDQVAEMEKLIASGVPLTEEETRNVAQRAKNRKERQLNGGNGNGHAASDGYFSVPPTKRVLKKLVAEPEDLDPTFVLGMQYVLEGLDENRVARIKGLKAKLRSIYEPEPAPAKSDKKGKKDKDNSRGSDAE